MMIPFTVDGIIMLDKVFVTVVQFLSWQVPRSHGE
jgi:hypothetical protein